MGQDYIVSGHQYCGGCRNMHCACGGCKVSIGSEYIFQAGYIYNEYKLGQNIVIIIKLFSIKLVFASKL